MFLSGELCLEISAITFASQVIHRQRLAIMRTVDMQSQSQSSFQNAGMVGQTPPTSYVDTVHTHTQQVYQC